MGVWADNSRDPANARMPSPMARRCENPRDLASAEMGRQFITAVRDPRHNPVWPPTLPRNVPNRLAKVNAALPSPSEIVAERGPGGNWS